MLEMAIQWALQNAPTVLIGVFVTILLPFLIDWISAHGSSKDLENIAFVCDVVYGFVNNIARVTPSQVDDKAALALKEAKDRFPAIIKNKRAEEQLAAALKAKHERERATTTATVTVTESEKTTQP